VDAVKEHAKSKHYSIPDPITHRQFLKKLYDESISGFLFDDTESFINNLTKIKINAITINQDI